MSCPITTEMLSAYADDLLSPSERDLVTQHLAECGECAAVAAALQDEAEALRSALGAGRLPTEAFMRSKPAAQPLATLWKLAAAAALVMATSLTTIWLDRMTSLSETQRSFGGLNLIKIFSGAKSPKITIRVSRDDSRWRIAPACYVVNREGAQPPGEDDVDL